MANIALNNLALITQEDTHNIVKNKDPKGERDARGGGVEGQ